MRRKHLSCLLAGTVFALGAIGCDQKQDAKVDTDKTRTAFKQDVQNKLTKLDSRIAAAKKSADRLDQSARGKVEAATEMAEEKIETIRDTMLGQLDSAVGEDRISEAKKKINDALEDAEDQVAKAEDAVKGTSGGDTADRQQSADELGRKLDQLQTQLDQVRRRAREAGGDAESSIAGFTETAEEAIDEGRDQVGKLKSGELGQDARETVNDLIEKGEEALNKAEQELENDQPDV